MAKVTHPNVVTVHDVGAFGDRVFIAMEFVRGPTLAQWLASAERSPEAVLAQCSAAGRGLEAAHAQGLIHRDFKPENVLVGDDGRVRVVDFGLASLQSSDPDGPCLATDKEGSEAGEPTDDPAGTSAAQVSGWEQRLTKTGSRAGTPAYMAPEQHRGMAVDAKTDQFCFAVALWEALYGERPFAGSTSAAVAIAVCGGELRAPPAGRERRVPRRIRMALVTALAVEPSARHPTMGVFLTALRATPRTSGRGLAVMLTLGAGLVAVALWPASKDPCSAGKSRVARLWSVSQQARLKHEFEASGLAFARQAAGNVVQGLDAYADAWTQEHRNVCEATHLRHEQSDELLDLRMSCLNQQLAGFAATVDALQSSAPAVVLRSTQAIANLPRASKCSELDARTVGAQVPSDADEAAEVQLIRLAVDRLRAQTVAAGHYTVGLADGSALLERAKNLDFEPLTAELAYFVGKIASSAGKPVLAREALEEAVFHAISSGHTGVHAKAATALVVVVGLELSQYEAGIAWGRQAEAAVRRVGIGGVDDIELAHSMCQMLADKGDVAAALPKCERAVALSEELFGEEAVQTGDAYEALGIVYYHQGRYERAGSRFELARNVRIANKGADHPAVALVYGNLAAVCLATRSAAPCVDGFRRGVEILERAFGPGDVRVADSANNLAIVLVDAGQLDEAEQRANQALAARREQRGDDHPGVAASLRVLGQVAQQRGNLELASEHFERALTIAIETRGPRHRDVLETLGVLAKLRAERGEYDLALKLYRRALALSEDLDTGPRNKLRFELAQLLWTQPRGQAEARGLARVAVADADKDTPLHGEITQWLAARAQ